MASTRTAEQQRQYMADWRARKKAKQQESPGLVEPIVAEGSLDAVAAGQGVQKNMDGKTWRSAEAFAAAIPTADIVLTAKDVHAQCFKAEQASWKREEQARQDYKEMQGILEGIAANARRQQSGGRQFTIYEDAIARIITLTEEVHERERQAAEFAVDMDEPF